MKLHFGHISGVEVFEVFKDRDHLRSAGVMHPPQSGIEGREHEGACAIVVSEGFADDKDEIDQILYTGMSGARDEKTGLTTKDQELVGQNAGLIYSYRKKLPVRVTRGYQTKYGPTSGYRYDGLYYVNDYEYIKSDLSGFKVYKFALSSELSYVDMVKGAGNSIPDKNTPPPRALKTSNSPVRNAAISNKVKGYYDYTCQVCNIPLKGNKKKENISIGAHIKGLGIMHGGPDVESNILCLCPNHHDLFDDYGFYIDQNFKIVGLKENLQNNPEGRLVISPEHKINMEQLLYHQEWYDKY